jgi:hypothetical protein
MLQMREAPPLVFALGLGDFISWPHIKIITCLMDHCKTWRMGRLPKIQTVRSHCIPTWPPIFQIRLSRMETQKCVNRLAEKRGFLRLGPSAVPRAPG